jgi:endonuclease/exonuclease/phosphatase family metal-dependent hydrolase
MHRRLRGLIRSLCVGVFVVQACAETLTVATYNIENYGLADRMTAEGFRKDYPKPEAEKLALRRVIRALHADVLALQEVGGQAFLDELRRDLGTEGLDYPHAALATAVDADRHVALLSKRPLQAVRTHDALEFSYFGRKERVKRGLLEATVATSAGEVTLFVLHLKSRFTERADDPLASIRRAGEATAIRDAVLQRFPTPATARFIVLGDCNDGKTSRAVAHLAARGKTAVAVLLAAADTRGEVWSHYYRREDSYSRVDQIFVSPGLRPAVNGGAARIHDGEGVLDASDHRPLIVTLNF